MKVKKILEHEQATVRERMAVPHDGSMDLENRYSFQSVLFVTNMCLGGVKFNNTTEYSI